MQNIPYLKQGDIVLIITPAKSIDALYIDKAKALFSSWGLQVEVGQNALGSYHYFSGTDDERAADLQWALNHPTAKAIICARGGYGTIRIMDLVDFTEFEKHPKWLVGFSDITILHNYLHGAQIPSIHGTVPLQFDQLSPDSETLTTLKKALFGTSYEISFATHSSNKTGKATAQLVGGNLAILESLIGTDLDIETEGKILFIEEISEYAYKLDRMMWALKKSGKLSGLAGLLIGGLTDVKECQETFGCTAEELISSFVSKYEYPVAFNLPAGHQLDNRSLVLGAEYNLTVSSTESVLKQSNHGQS